ncbi:MAG: hypothetical protein JST33_10700 [Actinobacteria bacterium]|nr:hypothetical protein [Actinomycetota bacterium]
MVHWSLSMPVKHTAPCIAVAWRVSRRRRGPDLLHDPRHSGRHDLADGRGDLAPLIIAATFVARIPPGASATTPVVSMPGTLGNEPNDPRPLRKRSSDRFSPNARTSIGTCPGAATGRGTSRICSTSGEPGVSSTIARIVVAMSARSS